ncbi:hypothetical protein SAMN02745220_00624 [Desulfopila aestuarii DSM 18488]|uniref:Mpv17 / PMP22 family protein n=2 Tax=Desulfopila aestuarii TaxID=231440 RepID=A0A1M7XYD3_9BACT|nr:hypothetical protein SAMN02745220_00624 [Desulfopila aestuarii DSM 18488]
MKVADFKVFMAVFLFSCVFIFIPEAGEAFRNASIHHGFILSFFKFAILATFGECLALRMRTGSYNQPGFGILPRMFVWGILGVIIKTAFTVFYTGTPSVLVYLGFADKTADLFSGSMELKVLTVFCISAAMNMTFAPVMMTMHKITDMHITSNGGKLSAFLSHRIDFAQALRDIDWKVMWNVVFKKTIPFFWIPAHTITFLLPAEFQMLIAALLGMALGLILAAAGNLKQETPCLATT